MAGINLLTRLKEHPETVIVEGMDGSSGGGGSGRFLSSWSLRQKIQLVLLLAGLVAIPLSRDWLANTYLPSKLEAPQAELDETLAAIKIKEAEKARVAALELELNEFEKQVADIKQKIEKIRQIQEGDRDRVVRMVDYIVTQMPEPVWIREVALEARSGAQVLLMGQSMNYQNISTFVGRLETGAFFPKWELEESRREMLERPGGVSHAAMNFKLKAQVVDFQ